MLVRSEIRVMRSERVAWASAEKRVKLVVRIYIVVRGCEYAESICRFAVCERPNQSARARAAKVAVHIWMGGQRVDIAANTRYADLCFAAASRCPLTFGCMRARSIKFVPRG